MGELGKDVRSYAADPEVIEEAGGKALDIRQDLLDAAEPTCTKTSRAALGVDGWRTEDQLRKTAAIWEDQTRALAERMGRTGANLQHSGRNYQATEAANTAVVREVDSPWG